MVSEKPYKEYVSSLRSMITTVAATMGSEGPPFAESVESTLLCHLEQMEQVPFVIKVPLSDLLSTIDEMIELRDHIAALLLITAPNEMTQQSVELAGRLARVFFIVSVDRMCKVAATIDTLLAEMAEEES